MKAFERSDGNRATFGVSGDRPTVRYNDGPEHVLLNESHAKQVQDTLRRAEYTEVTA